jgi:intraflagellar transport protein 56
LSEFELAEEYVTKDPMAELQTRLLFHISHQIGAEQEMFQDHSQLVGTFENQLSLAAIHYMLSNYQNAIDVYKKLFLQCLFFHLLI